MRPHPMARKRCLLSLCPVLLALLLASCGRLELNIGPLLRDVSVAPDQISPNADGDTDVTEISYSLSRSANVSIFFENEEGERFYFRRDRRRSPGSYGVLWGGVMDEPKTETVERVTTTVLSQVLPDGRYRWVVQATDDNAATETAEGTITLANGDTDVPSLDSFAVFPPTFRPNLDGLLDDWVSISYSLSKDVDFVQVYLLDPLQPGVKFHIAEGPNTIEPEEKGHHSYRYNGGADLNAEPPPDGVYQVVGEAADLAGNRVMVSSDLTIEGGGRPRADVVQGEIEWVGETNRVVSVPLGQKLCFSAIVKNEGKVPIRTNGPWPGQEYLFDEDYAYETFNSVAARPENRDKYWFEQPGVFRFAINFSTTGYPYPFRWAVGRQEDLERLKFGEEENWYLMPGKSGEVSGCIHFDGRPPGGNVLWWGGLIHEAYGNPNDFIDRITVNVGTQ